jgi:molybdopterin synthase catalytic subunit
MISITDKSIDITEVIASVQDPSAGGSDVFIGTTRNRSHDKQVKYLEYEAYVPMAKEWMERIAREALRRWDVIKISIVHRVGNVGIGEVSVVIAVSAVHRREAFEACRFLIDTLKRDVPIWKKEYFEDGEMWVGLEGTLRPGVKPLN